MNLRSWIVPMLFVAGCFGGTAQLTELDHPAEPTAAVVEWTSSDTLATEATESAPASQPESGPESRPESAAESQPERGSESESGENDEHEGHR